MPSNNAEATFRSTQIEKINLHLENDLPVDWSPDGKSILLRYITGEKGGPHYSRLGLLNLEDNSVQELDIPIISVDNNGEFFIGYAFFSAAGNEVYFQHERNIYLYDLKNNQTSQITNTGNVISFTVSPKGNIYYSTERYDATTGSYHYTVWKLDAQAKNPQKIADNDDLWQFDVNSDETKLLYIKTIDPTYPSTRVLAVYDLKTDESSEIPKTDFGCGTRPIWTPSDILAIYDTRSCSVIPVNDLVITDLYGNSESLAGANTKFIEEFIVSPDGAFLIYEEGGDFYKMTLAKPVPEFPFVIPVFMISITSLIAFYRTKIRK